MSKRNPKSSNQEEPKKEFQPVLCDICVGTQVPALKTCLKCEISMCAQHLQVHLTTPVLLQTHPLTKPTAPGGLSSGAVRCPEHGKLLEYYCLFDRTCVCVSCSIEGQHRLHDMKTLPSAHKVLVEKLREELKQLAEREKQANAMKSWETEGTKALEVSTEYLVKRVSALRDTGLTKVQSSVAARLGLIQTARQNIEAALSEEDAHMFLQKFAGVHEAVEKARVVNFIHGLEEEAEPTEVVSDILKNGHQATKKVRMLQRDLLVLVDPDKLYWGESKPANVTFDPKTLGQHFLVSSDLKMLSCRPPIQPVPQTVHLQISTGNDLHWTIEFSEKFDWSVGISAQALDSLGSDLHGPVYGLEWINKTFMALRTNARQQTRKGFSNTFYSIQRSIINDLPKSSTSLDSMDSKKKIEVHLDYSARLLSFFIRCECEVICLHRVEIDYSCKFPFVTLVKRQNNPANNMSVRVPSIDQSYLGRGYQPQINVQNSTGQYVDFVCALDDENLQTLYSRGKKCTP